MKVAFIYSTKKLSGLLTKWFTGSYCYHVGFVDTKSDTFYDMNLLRRKRSWFHYSHGKDVVLVECPVDVSVEFLEEKLRSDENVYGVLDYMLFAVRPIYHLFGLNTRNAKGVICSEMVYNDLSENGWDHIFSEVPSPADLEKELL